MSANNRTELEALRAKYSRVFKVDIDRVKIVEYPDDDGSEVSCPT